MGADIIIREARPGDGQAMSDYIFAVVAEKLDTILLNAGFTAEQEEDLIADFARRGRAAILLAVEGDRVIGFLDIACGPRPGNRHAAGFGMSVAADRRGQGVGKRLLQAAIAKARSWDDCCRIELRVTPWNTAGRALYESLGFQVEGVLRKGINLRGEPEDDLIMGLVW